MAEDMIEEALDAYNAGDSTLFFVDSSLGEESREYFLSSSRFTVLDCKNLQTKRMVNIHSVYPILEEARHSLVYAMKYGKTLVMRMGDCIPDFIEAMCDENCKDRETSNPLPPHQEWKSLPRGFMIRNAQLVRDNAESFLRREDWREVKEGDCEPLHPKFKLIVTTTVPIGQVPDLFLNGRYGLPGKVEDYEIIAL